MAQQTSVEWLIQQVNGNPATTMAMDIPEDIIEQAKEMEKDHLENAWMDGLDYGSNNKDFEDYYNKTYDALCK